MHAIALMITSRIFELSTHAILSTHILCRRSSKLLVRRTPSFLNKKRIMMAQTTMRICLFNSSLPPIPLKQWSPLAKNTIKHTQSENISNLRSILETSKSFLFHTKQHLHPRHTVNSSLYSFRSRPRDPTPICERTLCSMIRDVTTIGKSFYSTVTVTVAPSQNKPQNNIFSPP